MEPLTVWEIGRYAKPGRRYPSPLPAHLRDVHVRAARGFGWSAVAGVLLGLAGFVGLSALHARFVTASLTALIAGVLLVSLTATGYARHSAVLKAYGVELDALGRPEPTRSELVARRREQAVGLDLRTEASRALRWYWSISAVGLGTTVGVMVFTGQDLSPYNRHESPWWVHVGLVGAGLLVAVGLGRALHVLMERVALAGGPPDPGDRRGGWTLVVVALLCVTISWAVHLGRIADEPVATVDAEVGCTRGRIDRCWASYEYAGSHYRERVSPHIAPGPRQLEISSAHPHVVITGEDNPFTRYGIWVLTPVALACGARWLSRSVELTRRLRRAARGEGAVEGPAIPSRLPEVDPSLHRFLPPYGRGPGR
ncbi:hypothetical protein [Pseudonocardia zijingensis]|uniref:hypothetical protein n=1 Tax=Pseudonocardia zijingensis TaxID=153376 RepID=UPI0031D2B6CA